MEIAVTAKMTDQVVDAISKAAHTGKIGDGKIFALDLEAAAPRGWFEHGTNFVGSKAQKSGLKASPIIAP